MLGRAAADQKFSQADQWLAGALLTIASVLAEFSSPAGRTAGTAPALMMRNDDILRKFPAATHRRVRANPRRVSTKDYE
jgi:hypothetical protein